jgi:hypothetical protein
MLKSGNTLFLMPSLGPLAHMRRSVVLLKNEGKLRVNPVARLIRLSCTQSLDLESSNCIVDRDDWAGTSAHSALFNSPRLHRDPVILSKFGGSLF